VLTDEQIARLTPAERRDLILRLGRPLEELGITRRELRLDRRLRLSLLTVCVVVLVPWIGYLAMTLPHRHQVRSWDATWVGFDLLLLLMLAVALVLGWRRSLLVVPAVCATGALLVCDAWFDVMTAHGEDRMISILAAVLVELPLAAVLFFGSQQVLRLTAARLWYLDPGQRSWQVRIPLPSEADTAVRRSRRPPRPS
jgi:hypothetical protein